VIANDDKEKIQWRGAFWGWASRLVEMVLNVQSDTQRLNSPIGCKVKFANELHAHVFTGSTRGCHHLTFQSIGDRETRVILIYDV
jgi:hypothetical protein